MKKFRWQGEQTSHSNKNYSAINFVAPILTLTVIIGILYLLFGSNIFKIKNIKVEGNDLVDDKLISEIIRPQLDDKRFWLLSEANILVFNETIAVEKINHPRISSVAINKSLPSTILVSITEKEPIAIWSQQNRWYELDSEGVVISETGGPDGNSIVLINSDRVDPSTPGTQVVNTEAITFAKTISANMPRGLGFDINQFDIAKWDNYSMTVLTSEGWNIRFSNQLDISDQILKLKTFIIQKNKDGEDWRNALSYIDLRFGSSRIYYR